MTDSGCPYARALGPAWCDVHSVIRVMHEHVEVAAGVARIDHGASPLARLLVRILGFPPAAEAVPVQVRFAKHNGSEVWVRHFGDCVVQSRQWARDGLLVERFGALEFSSELAPAGGRLNIVLRRWRAFGAPLPRWLGPKATAYEANAGGVFRFFVEIGHPWVGMIVRYSGWLKPQPPEPPRT